MLKGLDPLLSPRLIYYLARIGHGDEIAIVDANFPAESLGRHVVRIDGANAVATLDAVLTVLPLDDFTETAAFTMQVVGDDAAVPPVIAEFRDSIRRHGADRLETLERFDFYERARAAFAILQTGETRLYGNVILTKGVVAHGRNGLDTS